KTKPATIGCSFGWFLAGLKEWGRWVGRALRPVIFLTAAALLGEEASRLENVEWRVYRGDNKAIQYSSLDQINTGNVHELKLAWEYHHGLPESPSMYSNPLIVDGLLYFVTPRVNAVALDAETGREVWVWEAARHDPQRRVFRGRNRGLVYWEDEHGQKR